MGSVPVGMSWLSIVGEQIGLGGGQRMAGIGGDFLPQHGGRGDDEPVFGNHAADRLAHAEPFGRSDENGQIEPAARFVPTAERAGGRVFAHGFAGLGLEGKLPVVDDARALRCQMGDQPALDQPAKQRPATVLDEMRAVGEHDGGAAAAGGDDAFGQTVDLPIDRRARGSTADSVLFNSSTMRSRLRRRDKGNTRSRFGSMAGIGHDVFFPAGRYRPVEKVWVPCRRLPWACFRGTSRVSKNKLWCRRLVCPVQPGRPHHKTPKSFAGPTSTMPDGNRWAWQPSTQNRNTETFFNVDIFVIGDFRFVGTATLPAGAEAARAGPCRWWPVVAR